VKGYALLDRLDTFIRDVISLLTMGAADIHLSLPPRSVAVVRVHRQFPL
jgi:hypothetical protein